MGGAPFLPIEVHVHGKVCDIWCQMSRSHISKKRKRWRREICLLKGGLLNNTSMLYDSFDKDELTFRPGRFPRTLEYPQSVVI